MIEIDGYFVTQCDKDCVMTSKPYPKKKQVAALRSSWQGKVVAETTRAVSTRMYGLGADGRVEADHLAKRFNMTKPALAATLGLGQDALQREDRATAPKSQLRMREMLEIIALVQGWAGSETAAMSWYRATPIPAFGGRTAEALVKEGKAHLVREYVDHLALGGYA